MFTFIGYVKKIGWFIVNLFTLSLLLLYFSNISMLFFTWPVNVKVDMLSKRELLFPAVTICNMNPIKQSALEVSHLKSVKSVKT